MIIYGMNPVADFIKSSPEKISKIFISKTKDKFLNRYSKMIRNIDIEYVSEKELERMTSSVKHQSIAAKIEVAPPKEFEAFKHDIKKMTNIVLVLDHLKDPQNLGAISRTAAFFNINTIVIPKNRSVTISPGAVKASAGTILFLNIYEVANLLNSIRELKKNHYWILGADIDGESVNDKKFDKFKGDKLALVLGSEDKGVSAVIKKNCDILIKINRLGRTDSLNVSVAAGILMSRFLDD